MHSQADPYALLSPVCTVAVELMDSFNSSADTNGKTKMFHVIVYIIPRFIQRCASISNSNSMPISLTLACLACLSLPVPSCRIGNLWRMSTAKLEARGKCCKFVVRRQTSARPRAAGAGTGKASVTIQKRGGSLAQKKKGVLVQGTTTFQQGYDSSQMAQLVGVLGLREQRSLSKTSRGSAQLAQLGKLRHDLKLGEDSSVPDEVKALVPGSHPYTCESVFESILRGEFDPLYSLEGIFRRS
eukprot:5177452-Pleurochrysis_carterae.AAC.1